VPAFRRHAGRSLTVPNPLGDTLESVPWRCYISGHDGGMDGNAANYRPDPRL